MAGIQSDRKVSAEMASAGFSLLRADEITISDEMLQSWLALSIDYSDLPAVDYPPRGGAQRFRRYGRFSFWPDSGMLRQLPHDDYYPGTDGNPDTGGYARRFAPLLDSTFENIFLRELIRFDYRQFPPDAANATEVWEVQVHLIRVKASEHEAGKPAPQRLLPDGAELVALHLAELVNARGGQVSLFDDEQNLVASFRLNQVMDSYLAHDARLWHSAAPIGPLKPEHEAIRSILKFDFHPRSASV